MEITFVAKYIYQTEEKNKRLESSEHCTDKKKTLKDSQKRRYIYLIFFSMIQFIEIEQTIHVVQ